MALQIHELPTSASVPSNAYMILKREVSGSQLDYKVDINFLFSPYVNRNTEIGTGIGQLVELIDVNGNPGFPAVDGSQLTNLFPERASDVEFGVTQLSDSTTSTSNAATGETAATPLAVRNMGLTKLSTTGGDVSGHIIFNNNIGVQIRRSNNVPTLLFTLDGTDDLLIGSAQVNDIGVTCGGTFAIKDDLAANVLVVNTANGDITATGSMSFVTGKGTTFNGYPMYYRSGTGAVQLGNASLLHADVQVQNSFRVRDLSDNVIFELNTAGQTLIGFEADKIGVSSINGDNYAHVQAALEGIDAKITIPPASSVTVTPTGGISSTDVQAALAELDAEKISTIPNASGITFTPTGGLSSTDVQAALAELDAEKVSSIPNASGIVFTPTGDIVATNVQAAIAELDTEKLSTTGTAANSNQLGGVAASSYLVKDGFGDVDLGTGDINNAGIIRSGASQEFRAGQWGGKGQIFTNVGGLDIGSDGNGQNVNIWARDSGGISRVVLQVQENGDIVCYGNMTFNNGTITP